MKRKLITALVATNMVLIALFLLSANGVLISNNAGNAHSSAALEVRSTTQGFLPPVLTSTQRDNVSSPATGLTIYNSTTSAIETYNGSTWQSSGGTNANVPAGTVIAYAGSTIPSGWLECNGDDISRTNYADLFAAIGTAWGYGDQSTTFNLPDMRGRFLRGHNNASGNDPDASSRSASATGGNSGDNVGTYQADNFKSHRHKGFRPSASYKYINANSNRLIIGDFQPSGSSSALYPSSASNEGGNETRPRNVAVKYIIKY